MVTQRWGSAIAFLAVALTGATMAQAESIRGTATYRERIMLPPDAVFEATIEDISRADVPSVVVGRVTMEPAGQVPIRFEIAYDPAKIDERFTYSVRAKITRGGKLMYTTTEVAPVITRGAGKEVELMMQSVGRPGSPPDRPLTNTYWKLIELGGKKAEVYENQREPNLILKTEKNAVGGSGGCNNFAGSYTIDGPKLTFSPLASTRKMCIAGMEQEDAYLKALARVAAWRTAGDDLELLDGTGAVVARFVAVDL